MYCELATMKQKKIIVILMSKPTKYVEIVAKIQ